MTVTVALNETATLDGNMTLILSITAANELVSDRVLATIASIVDLWMCLVVAAVGIVANIITAVVYARMGFRDTVNITMAVVAFWDLVRTLCGALHRFYGVISWISPDVGVSWRNITLTNVVYIQLIAGNVSYVIGGYVALERCACVCAPFKVKSIFTPRFTLTACISLSCLVLATQLPVIFVLEYVWVVVPGYQSPIAVYRFTQFYKSHGQAYMDFYRYINLAYSAISLAVMAISTLVIADQLRKSSKFRSVVVSIGKFGPDAGKSGGSGRDGQVVKMLILVISTYMVVLVPRVAHYTAQLIEPSYYVMKLYNNLFWVIVYVISLLDFVNSSINLFIFYAMSSKFRVTCQSLFTFYRQ